MKLPRLQFSLLMVLVLMVVVGIGLMIYRWPWVEVSAQGWETVDLSGLVAKKSTPEAPFDPFTAPAKETPSGEFRTTYRRGWRGQPVKHGSAQYWSAGKLREDVNFYNDELYGPKKIFNEKGELIIEEVYRAGRRHGPFRAGNGQESQWEGNYENDRWHGAWKGVVAEQDYFQPHYSEAFNRDGSPKFEDFWRYSARPIVLKSEWQRGERHGNWSWETQDGKVLETAEYRQDELVSWNGKPVVEQFRQWLKGLEKDEPQLVATIAATENQQWCWRGRWKERLIYQVGNSVEGGKLFPVHVIDGENDRLKLPAPSGKFVPYLCEIAAMSHYRWKARYGVLWMVSEQEGLWPAADPTGIAAIKLAAGSQAEREWNETIPVLTSNSGFADCLRALLRDTSFTFDLSAVNADPTRPVGTDSDVDFPPEEGEVLYNLRRCDALGVALFLAGYHVELAGKKLVISPRGKNRWSEPGPYPHRGAYPLKPPQERALNSRIPPQKQKEQSSR